MSFRARLGPLWRPVTPSRQLWRLSTRVAHVERARRGLDRFFAAWGRGAPAVTFQLSDDLAGRLPGARPWQDVVGADQAAALREQAARLCADLTAQLAGEDLSLPADAEECVALYSEALALLHLSTAHAGPMFVAVPATEGYRDLKLDPGGITSRVAHGWSRWLPRHTAPPLDEEHPLTPSDALLARWDREAATEQKRDADEAVWRRQTAEMQGQDVLCVLDDPADRAGLRMVQDLIARGHRPLILTATGRVARAAQAAGLSVVRQPFVANAAEHLRAVESHAKVFASLVAIARQHGPGSSHWIFVYTLIERILARSIVEAMLEEIESRSPRIPLVSIGQPHLLGRMAARWDQSRYQSPDARGELLYASAGTSQMSVARRYLTSVLSDAKGPVRAMSFYYPTEEDLSDITQLQFWRTALTFHEETSLMEDGYRRFDRLLGELAEPQRALLRPFYHECATQLFEAAAFLHVHATTTARQYLLVSGDCGVTGAYQGLALERRMLMEKVPADALDPRAYQEILRRQLKRQITFRLSFDREAAAEERDATESVWRRDGSSFKGEADILFVLDDAGPGHFLGTGLRVLKALAAAGRRVLVLTSVGAVVRAVAAIGLPVVRLPFVATGREYLLALKKTIELIAALRHVAARHGPGTPEWIFIHNVVPRLLNYVKSQVIAETVLNQIGTKVRPTCIFSIFEGHFLPLLAGRWGKKRGLPWISYISLLISDHPESKFFPADQHLVYGEQGAELLLQAGVSSETVHVVGAELFDRAYGRDPDADRRAMESFIPSIRGRKLVVVGSEDRPDQMEEIEAILEELTPMQDLHVVIKLHPDDPADPFYQMVKRLEHGANATVIPKCDLHALLHVADLLICVRSNIIIEAAVMGTPTLVCDFNPELARINMVDEGIALGCWRREDVAAKTRQCLFDEATIAAHSALTRRGLARFNGPNDGNSCGRVVDFLGQYRRSAPDADDSRGARSPSSMNR